MNSFFVELNYLDLMSVSGIDSERFLQGQLTCDVDAVSSGKSSLAAVCDNKGRVLASFRLANLQDSFFLEMQPGVMALLKPALEKYGVFYKSTLEDAASRFRRYGLAGPESEELLSQFFPALPENLNQIVSIDNAHLIKLSASPVRFELWLDSDCQQISSVILGQALPQANRSEWELLDIQAGIYQIDTDDSGLYTPQVLNYDLAGLISFSKGCYTGQEIVARMHYRGKAKKRLYRLAIESSQEIQAKEIIQFNDSSETGQILKIEKTRESNYEALALLKTKIEDNEALNDLILRGQVDSLVKVLKLNYS